MRILMVNSNGADQTLGGAERYVAQLTEGLESRGHDVQLLSAFPIRDGSAARTVVLHDSDWREDRLRAYRNHAADWVSLPPRRLREAIRQAKPDIVHTNNLPGIGTGIWEQARRLAIPVVHTLHDYHLLCPRTSLTRRDGSPCRPSPLLCGLRTRQMTRWAGGVTVVVGVSQFMVARLGDCFPAATERRTIQAPLQPIRATPPDPTLTAVRRIGYLGSLTVNKGVRMLLEAAPRLAALGVSVRIAGDGPLREEVRASSAAAYVGHVRASELSEFLSSCDAGVVPSLWDEPAGLVVREWLAAGRPVLSSGRGGLAEAAALGGVRQFDGTAAGLEAAVGDLRNPPTWKSLLSRVPAVTDTRDFDRWVAEYEDVYLTAIHPGRGARPAVRSAT